MKQLVYMSVRKSGHGQCCYGYHVTASEHLSTSIVRPTSLEAIDRCLLKRV